MYSRDKEKDKGQLCLPQCSGQGHPAQADKSPIRSNLPICFHHPDSHTHLEDLLDHPTDKLLLFPPSGYRALLHSGK